MFEISIKYQLINKSLFSFTFHLHPITYYFTNEPISKVACAHLCDHCGLPVKSRGEAAAPARGSVQGGRF